jgi:hypothetical protein
MKELVGSDSHVQKKRFTGMPVVSPHTRPLVKSVNALGGHMKFNLSRIAIASCLAMVLALGCGIARADADDDKWIAQCMKDNKDEGAKEEVVYKYCACMNDKMSKDETRSISQWEKTHKKEMKECEKKAGWK